MPCLCIPSLFKCSFQALHSMGIKSFETLAEADPRRIEIVTGRKYPFGNHIKESLLSLPPKVDMKIEEIKCQGQGKSKLLITLTRLSQSVQSTKRHYADMVCFLEFVYKHFYPSLVEAKSTINYNPMETHY